jgi:hypothetical protein
MVYAKEERVRRARATHSNVRNRCLQNVRTWCGIGARWPSARIAWTLGVPRSLRITDRRKIRYGDPVWLTKATSVYGHITLCVGHDHDGEPMVRSTDYPQAKTTSTVRLDRLERAWGYRFLGTARYLNGKHLP